MTARYSEFHTLCCLTPLSWKTRERPPLSKQQRDIWTERSRSNCSLRETPIRSQPIWLEVKARMPRKNLCKNTMIEDGVIKWKHLPRYWPFVRGIHRSPVNSPHKGQWRRALMFSLICVWINDWVNDRETGGLRQYCTHYDVIVMIKKDDCCKMTIYWGLNRKVKQRMTNIYWK